ncbi:hypothetical protein RFN29_15685 [Mesorhizobium sp. VK22B]|uniref:Uncharacterized protein n=1 Tax=Mesorhizobium captivum TaxID=3072319 RepID=A0ABU4Z1A3_9HYPH|nr:MULTISPECIES: hypothetical protein [unclassified Mesorhizobium]MDX8493019.1 hypothetical protein [Mesorhizobium sp. VK22B]MDX8509772.1 hypothetical protein [Mesorhizobium sp. VK22E]
MKTLQAIVVMLCIGPFANSPVLARGYDGSRNDDQATVVAASLPGLATAGSTARTVRAIPVAWSCPPGYVAGRYYRSCVLARRRSYPTSTPSAEQLSGAAAANQTCVTKGLVFAGDITIATHGGTCMCPPGLRSSVINNWASSRNECFP